jgi:hypothetical protein
VGRGFDLDFFGKEKNLLFLLGIEYQIAKPVA